MCVWGIYSNLFPFSPCLGCVLMIGSFIQFRQKSFNRYRICKYFLLVCVMSHHCLNSVFLNKEFLISVKSDLSVLSFMDHAFVSYLRKLCLTDDHKGIYIFFFYEFYCCKSYSFSTKLLWLYNKSVLHTMYGLIPRFYSVSLISSFIFMPVPRYIDYCNFTILVSDSVGLSVFLVFHRFVLRCLPFHMNFRIGLSVSKKSSFLLCRFYLFYCIIFNFFMILLLWNISFPLFFPKYRNILNFICWFWILQPY